MQDEAKIQKYIDDLNKCVSLVLSQKNNDSLEQLYGTLFGELLHSIVQYKLVLEAESPLLLTKRYGATIFDRFENIMRFLQKFWLDTLSLKDDDDDIALVKKFIHFIS